MDIYKGGDLVDGLQKDGPFESEGIVHVAYQIAAAIAHLHEKSIGHRDIKGDNCMMDRGTLRDKQCKVVLTDFGTASYFDPQDLFTAQVGTRQFWAPELLDKLYGLSVDIWAQGVLMYGLVTGKFPFRDENDIRRKEVKIRAPKCDQTCKGYILGMLHKEAAQRFDSAAIMRHEYLSSIANALSDDGPEDPSAEGSVPTMIREDGANVGIQDRRQELVERLHQEHQGGGTNMRSAMDLQPFVCQSKKDANVRLGYEWWDASQIDAHGLLDMLSKASLAPSLSGHDAHDMSMLSKMLEEHGIDPSKFGSGNSKSLATLASEVRSGEARLMLDAAEHKKLVRVVEVVVVRLRCSDKFLVETAVDSTERGKYTTMRLPAKIRPPHENVKVCAERVLESLGLSTATVQLDLDKRETCEEEIESPSYPGVQTSYRKVIVEGQIDLASLGEESLTRVGLPGFTGWTAEDSKGSRFHEWMTEEDPRAKTVQFYLSAQENAVSSLVHAPIGMAERELQERLTAANINVGAFGENGARTLKDFSQELYRGEAFLTTSPSGELVRTVNVVILIIKDPASGRVLVQTHQVDARGSKTDKVRLPGGKCRPDENQFIAARQTLQREVEIDADSLTFSESVQFVEEQQQSSNYPGITTIYRKFLITAEL